MARRAATVSGGRRGGAFGAARLLVGEFLQDAAPAAYGHADAFGGLPVLAGPVLGAQGAGGGLAPHGVVESLVGGGDGAVEEGGEGFDEGVEEFGGGAVVGVGAPAGAGVAGEDGAAAQFAADPVPFAFVRVLHGAGEADGGGALGGDGGGEFGDAGAQGVDDAARGAADGLLPGGRVLGPVGEPGPQGGDGGVGEQAVAAAGRLGELRDREPRDVSEAGAGEQGLVLAGDVGDDLVGHAVEDGDEGGVVLLRGAQEVPGDGVGVAGGGGDHHPDVRGADEPGGEFAALDDEGVDVGGVEEGEAGGEGVGLLDAQGAAAAGLVVGGVAVGGAGAPDACEVREDTRVGEPVAVVRVADEDGGAGGGSEHAGFADAAADEGVDEGGLPGSGGSADDGEEGRLRVLEPGDHVVVELGEQLGPGAPGSGGAGEREGKTHSGDTVAQGGECVEELRPYVQGHHM